MDNQDDAPHNYLSLLHNNYKQLRQTNLVKNAPIFTDEDMNEFLRILNDTLPEKPEEAMVEQTIKALYYSNPYMFNTLVHNGRNAPNGARRDVRHFVLLTIGLEIVREFGLDKLVHLTWNKETHLYEARSLVDPNHPIDPEAFRAERQAKRLARLEQLPDSNNRSSPPKKNKDKYKPRNKRNSGGSDDRKRWSDQ